MSSPRTVLAVLCLMALLPASAGGKVVFRADAPAQAVAGEVFKVEFSVNAKADPDTFSAPSFEGCEVVKGPMPYRGYTYECKDGKESSSATTSYGYKLLSREAGRIAVGRAVIFVDGKQYRTRPFTVRVTAKDASQQTAGDVSFEVIVPESVAAGEAFRVVFRLNAAADEYSFTAPVFEGCERRVGPMTFSSRITKADAAKPSVTTEYSYILVCRSNGRVTIGPASVCVGGRRYDTQPQIVKVGGLFAQSACPTTGLLQTCEDVR